METGAAFGAMGGFRTFSADAIRSNRFVESRHPHLLETEKFAALPQAGCEPRVTELSTRHINEVHVHNVLMNFLKKLFGKQQASATEDALVLVFVPALAAILKAAENKKGSPLAELEVFSIRDSAVCIAVKTSTAVELEARRGYRDIVAENAWEEWQVLRMKL
ncbi:hypothetical protein ACM25N_04300 [Roseovarius sp. C7]|uniref:hypothetical protein n=1 Tax=Roseovarius sp. C7 TaxID=3398643 RepID=UPI0039F46511